MTFFKELEQTALKYVWNQKRPRIAKELLKRKTKLGASQCRISSCTAKLWSQREHGTGTNRHIDQWNRIENPEMDPRLFEELIFDKAGKNSGGKKTVSSINGAGKLDSYMQKNET